MLKRFALLCLLALPLASLSAHADTIGPTNCGSCLGSSYTLTYTPTANPDTFNIMLVINTTQFSNSSTDLLNAVALKVSSALPSVTLVSAPAGYTNFVGGGLNSGGCDGSGSGFFCTPYSGSGFGKPVGAAGDIYTFDYLVTVSSPSALFTSNLGASVKALYVDSTGKQNGITSEDITLQPGGPPPPPPPSVPEPNTLVLLGTGALGLAFFTKRMVA